MPIAYQVDEFRARVKSAKLRHDVDVARRLVAEPLLAMDFGLSAIDEVYDLNEFRRVEGRSPAGKILGSNSHVGPTITLRYDLDRSIGLPWCERLRQREF